MWTRRAPVYYQDFMTSEAARIEHWDYKLEGWVAMKAAQPTLFVRTSRNFRSPNTATPSPR